MSSSHTTQATTTMMIILTIALTLIAQVQISMLLVLWFLLFVPHQRSFAVDCPTMRTTVQSIMLVLSYIRVLVIADLYDGEFSSEEDVEYSGSDVASGESGLPLRIHGAHMHTCS
jgi:hypothetical protein